MKKLALSRSKKRGIATVETILGVAAVMACFVYPLSLAMRAAGAHIVNDNERANAAFLQQAP